MDKSEANFGTFCSSGQKWGSNFIFIFTVNFLF